MGDMIHDVYLDCGHKDTVVLRNANKKPAWMISRPDIGAKGECPWCKTEQIVVNVKLVQGWGD